MATSTDSGSDAGLVTPITPDLIRIVGAHAIPRTLHQDPRGFLVETMRGDDVAIDGARFRMTYTSVTIPGEFRDVDRWHLHQVQTDRFVVPLGEMMLALYDGRPGSPTHGLLEVIRMAGVPLSGAAATPKREVATYLVPIPPGVNHVIGNVSSEPFVLQNFPTEYYNPADEGRVPFVDQSIPALGRPFSWDLVPRSPAP